MFRDKYTNFTFNDLKSENFHVWLTNKHDIKYNLSPRFTDKFNTPTLGQIRYYEGTQIDQQEINIQCAAIDITLDEWKAITEWLSPLKIGKLRFEWNPHYYYLTKISKQITAEVWNKSRIDPVLGNLYIVTFNITFTTINDWAALSDASEGFVLRQDDPKYEVDDILSLDKATQGDIYYDKETKRYYECIQTVTNTINPVNSDKYWEDCTVNDSMFNNQYYMPIIIPLPPSKPEEIPSQGGFWGSTIVEFFIKVSDLDSAAIFKVEGIDGTELKSIEVKADSVKCTHKYPGGLSWVEYPKIVVTEEDILTFRIQSAENEYWESSKAGLTFNIIRWNVYGYSNSFLCNNAGTFELYPVIYATIPYSLGSNYKEYCSFRYNGIQTSTYATMLNSKNHTLSTYGTPIDSIINSVGMPVFTDINNKEQLNIVSGRPQIIKAYLKDVSNTTNGYVYKFSTSSKPIYDRFKSFSVNIIKKFQSTNIFDTDIYGEKKYSKILKNDDYGLFLNPIVKFEKNENNWTMTITVPTQSKAGSILLTKGDINKYFYISFCDSEILGIQGMEEEYGIVSVSCQTRDVI